MRTTPRAAAARGEALLEVSNLTKHYPVRKSAGHLVACWESDAIVGRGR